MQMRRVLLVSTLTIAATGCYSYVPTRMEAVEPGAAVRLRVTAEEAERLEPMRLTLTRQLDAVVLQRGADQLLIETQVGAADAQRGSRTLTQRLNVPLSEIYEVEFRRRDSLRTGLAVGALAAAVGVAIAAALDGGEGGPRDTTDPITELRPRRPFLTLPLRF
jgi:hypothetical protein